MIEKLPLKEVEAKLNNFEFTSLELKKLEDMLTKLADQVVMQIELENENEMMGDCMGFDETDFM